MNIIRHHKLFLFIAVWLNTANLLDAAVQFNYPAHLGTLSSGFYFRSWSIQEGDNYYRISQAAFPLTTVSPITNKINLLFATSHSTALMNRNLEDGLQGIADGKIKAFYQIIPNHLLLNGGISIPFGKNRLSTEEINVAEVLYESVLGFGVTRFGEGLDSEFGVSSAFRLTNTITIGAGLGFLNKGEYEFHKNSPITFKPGNEYSFSIGIDLNSDSLFFRNDILYKSYSTDKLDSEPYLKQGTQFEITSRMSYRIFPATINFLVKHVYKSDNQFYGSLNYYLTDDLNFIDNSTWLKMSIEYQKSSSLAFIARFGVNRFGKSAIQWGDATIYSAGLGLQKKISEYFMGRIESQVLEGSAQNNFIQLSGWDFSMTFILKI